MQKDGYASVTTRDERTTRARSQGRWKAYLFNCFSVPGLCIMFQIYLEPNHVSFLFHYRYPNKAIINIDLMRFPDEVSDNK